MDICDFKLLYLDVIMTYSNNEMSHHVLSMTYCDVYSTYNDFIMMRYLKMIVQYHAVKLPYPEISVQNSDVKISYPAFKK